MFGPWGDPHMAVLGDGFFAVYFDFTVGTSLTPPSYTGVRLRLLRKAPLDKDPQIA